MYIWIDIQIDSSIESESESEKLLHRTQDSSHNTLQRLHHTRHQSQSTSGTRILHTTSFDAVTEESDEESASVLVRWRDIVCSGNNRFPRTILRSRSANNSYSSSAVCCG